MSVALRSTLFTSAALLTSAWVVALPAAAQTQFSQLAQTAASQVGTAQTTFDFSGKYAPGNWQVRSRNSGGGFRFDGVDEAGTTARSLTIIGSDLGGMSQCNSPVPPDFCAPGLIALYIQVQVPEHSLLQFSWDYTTYDISGLPVYDPFGYVLPMFDENNDLLEGRFMPITDPYGSAEQSGRFSIELKEGDFFALQMGTLDNQFGRAVVTIDQFSVTSFLTEKPTESVPEPGSAISLILTSLSLLALRHRNASK